MCDSSDYKKYIYADLRYGRYSSEDIDATISQKCKQLNNISVLILGIWASPQWEDRAGLGLFKTDY
jgi:hypothetical protein